ncbi:MAG TPA: DUF4412 domain-containing protein [Candidatus Cybelea sp.]|nr:DUF4412 domain-containing protein [Candidatus Cybelea sp.]
MSKLTIIAAAALAALPLARPIQAAAGVVMTAVDATADANAQPRSETIYLEPDKIKVTMAQGGAIYRDGSKMIVTYNDRERSYMEINPAAVSAARAQAMEAMKQHMAQMPEEQRKRMEALMAQNDPNAAPAKPPQIVYRKVASGQTVGAWRCDQYEQSEDGRKVADLCIARLSDIGMNENDLTAFKGLSSLMNGLSPGAVAQAHTARLDYDNMKSQIGFAGMPVHTVDYGSNGQMSHETTIKSIQRVSIPADTFQVPDGYAKREMGMGMRRGGGG